MLQDHRPFNSVDRIMRPFGADEDANRAVADAELLELVAQLSVEATKLARTKFKSDKARLRQRQFVAGLRGQVVSRARSLHVDEDQFLAALQRELKRRTGTAFPIPSAPIADEDREAALKRLKAEYANAELFEQAAVRKAQLAAATLENAQRATLIAKAALDQYVARDGAAR